MEKVAGIRGFFFRAADPKALAVWYDTRLGVTEIVYDYGADGWVQETGETVFAPFAKDTDYFGRDTQDWMLNFRVHNLDAMVAQLRKLGETVEVEAEPHPNGRFARLYVPEGNPIELWQPT